MSQNNRQQVKEIFLEVIDLAPADQARRLAELCGENEELRRAVETLIRQDAEAGSLLEQPLADESGIHLFADCLADDDPLIGQKLGKYEVVREIGAGGMGAVYLARRADGAFEKDAAIKIVKRGMDTQFVVRRFRQERQILAALNHPYIARLLDGGTTDDGLPYFVMEYVAGGESLYDFADRRKLSISERLRLFCLICEAVEYAHQNRVIHRDLKPSNILVKPDGEPKLLDFGIAKVLNPDIGITTVDPTLTAMRMMTPEYASPEQIKGETTTPASDVYGLGVILYEFLSGHRPYRIKNRAPYEIARAVCEDVPERPSSNITRDDNFAPTTGEKTPTLENLCNARGASSVEELRRALAGDLECVVLKALRKDASERYESAGEFAADILRYLDGAEVSAKMDSGEKAAIASFRESESKSLAVLPLNFLNYRASADTGDEFLSIGLADALVSRLSGVQRLILRPTSSVLRFGAGGDPFAAGRELGVEFVLSGSIRRAGERLRVTAQLLNVPKGATLWSQSFDEKSGDVLALEDSLSEKIAESLLPQLTGDEARQINKRGTDSPEAYEAYLRGRYYWNQFTPEALLKARESFETALALDADYALAHVGIGDFYTWANIYGLIPSLPALEEAERHARRAVEIDEHLGEAHATLGHVAHNRRRWAESEKLKLRSIKLNPNYVNAREWWAAQLVGLGREREGVEVMKRAESLDPLSLRIKTLTAWTLYQAHRFDEALERARQIVELDKNYSQGYSQIGLALWAMRRFDEALPYFEKFDALIPDAAMPKYQLCFALASVNRQPEARACLNEIKMLAARGYVKPYFLAMAHVAAGESDAAFEYFEQSFEEYEPWLLWFGTEPMLERLHDDSRFVSFLERMNNPIAERFKK